MKIAFVCIGERPHAKYAVQSFKRVMPELEVVQITNHHAWIVDGVDSVFYVPGEDNLMLYMMDGFSKLDAPFITTADDCILERPVYDVLEREYDVAIIKRGETSEWSTRGYKYFPYNNGFVVVKNNQFYKDCYNNLIDISTEPFKGHDLKKWYGDMLCIANVLNTGKYRILELEEKMYSKKPMFDGDGNKDYVMWHYAKELKPWMKNHGRGQ